MCKIAGGIVNITRNESARQRWKLNYNERSHLMEMLQDMFSITTTTSFAPSTKTKSRSSRDFQDMRKIQEQLERYHLFYIEGENIVCISTGDVATQKIISDLVNALNRGRQIVDTFTDKRLTELAVDSVFSMCPRLKLKTFKDLKSTQAQKSKSLKTIKLTDIHQRLLGSISAGRQVDLQKVFKSELSAHPLSLFKADNSMITSDKSTLSKLLIGDRAVDSLQQESFEK